MKVHSAACTKEISRYLYSASRLRAIRAGLKTKVHGSVVAIFWSATQELSSPGATCKVLRYESVSFYWSFLMEFHYQLLKSKGLESSPNFLISIIWNYFIISYMIFILRTNRCIRSKKYFWDFFGHSILRAGARS